MKAKIFLSTLLAVFSILLVAGMTSALTFGSPSSNHPLDALTPGNNVTISLTNDASDGTGAQTITLDFVFQGTPFAIESDLIVKKQDGTVVFGPGAGTFTLAEGATENLIVSVNKVNTNIAYFSTPTVNLTATASSLVSASATLEYFQSFCDQGPISPLDGGDHILEISSVDITNGGPSDGEDDEWFSFDTIDIEVTIENNGDEDLSAHDLDDMTLEIGLLDSSGNNKIADFEFLGSPDEEKEDIGSLDPDDEETVTFRIRLEDSDEDFDGSFDFVVKAYEDGNEDAVCIDYSDDLENNEGFSQDISVERESDEENFIRFSDIIVPSQVTCGETVRLTADVVNIGDEDAEQLVAILRNNELGLDERESVSGGLDSGDQDSVVFEFNIPNNIQNKGYLLSLTSTYEIDDDPVSSDTEDNVLLNVIGCGVGSPSGSDEVAISASLVSGGDAGEELVVSATFTNTGDESTVVTVDASGFEDWAEALSISQRVFSLNAGESKTVTVTMSVDPDAEGTESFVIEATDASGNLETREVEVEIDSSNGSGSGITGSAIGELFGGSSGLVWIIVIVNIVLIILIILVAVRLSRRE